MSSIGEDGKNSMCTQCLRTIKRTTKLKNQTTMIDFVLLVLSTVAAVLIVQRFINSLTAKEKEEEKKEAQVFQIVRHKHEIAEKTEKYIKCDCGFVSDSFIL